MANDAIPLCAECGSEMRWKYLAAPRCMTCDPMPEFDTAVGHWVIDRDDLVRAFRRWCEDHEAHPEEFHTCEEAEAQPTPQRAEALADQLIEYLNPETTA